jgi:hypothetical protein
MSRSAESSPANTPSPSKATAGGAPATDATHLTGETATTDPGDSNAPVETLASSLPTIPRRDLSGMMASAGIHLLFMLVLSLFIIQPNEVAEVFSTLAKLSEEVGDSEIETPPETAAEKIEITPSPLPTVDPKAFDNPNPAMVDVNDLAPSVEDDTTTKVNSLIATGTKYAGRTGASRSQLVAAGGGNAESEAAVNNGLKWLAAHQLEDGSWSFNHGPDNPGNLENCHTGATGLALLAFLGAGHTHNSKDSIYRNVVNKGFDFLINRADWSGGDGADFRGKASGNDGMYAHAICAIALCEAFALTNDRRKLFNTARGSIQFIIASQNQKDGGWRYRPREPGDLSVTGWKVMALKSAQAARINALGLPNAIKLSSKFLDEVQHENGSKYAYQGGEGSNPTASMTAVGLLCRMYLGWNENRPALKKGIEFLSAVGPSTGDLYYNYYATQVLHHWGSEEWTKWNSVMRDRLIATQEKEGSIAGSWPPSGDHGAAPGGRLYQTCLSIMTLEVYYRHLPIYKRKTIKADF